MRVPGLQTTTGLLSEHTHTHAGCKPAFQIPKRDVGCLCLSVIHWVSTLCLARFSLGGTDSIHSPDNRLVIHSRDWEKLSYMYTTVCKSVCNKLEYKNVHKRQCKDKTKENKT